MQLKVDSETLVINEPIDPSEFTVEKLDLAKGTYVENLLTGEKSVYNDLPPHLKIAVMEGEASMASLDRLDANVAVAPTSSVTPERERVSGIVGSQAQPSAIPDGSVTRRVRNPTLVVGAAALVSIGALIIVRSRRSSARGGAPR
jgi:hypothetical protein